MQALHQKIARSNWEVTRWRLIRQKRAQYFSLHIDCPLGRNTKLPKVNPHRWQITETNLYVCDNRTEGEILIWRSCLINQDEFSLFLFVLFTIFYAQKDEKGFIRDLWLRPKLICDTWILQKGELDSWIYEPAWGVICLLKYTWPMIVFSKLVKTSWFP